MQKETQRNEHLYFVEERVKRSPLQQRLEVVRVVFLLPSEQGYGVGVKAAERPLVLVSHC